MCLGSECGCPEGLLSKSQGCEVPCLGVQTLQSLHSPHSGPQWSPSACNNLSNYFVSFYFVFITSHKQIESWGQNAQISKTQSKREQEQHYKVCSQKAKVTGRGSLELIGLTFQCKPDMSLPWSNQLRMFFTGISTQLPSQLLPKPLITS